MATISKQKHREHVSQYMRNLMANPLVVCATKILRQQDISRCWSWKFCYLIKHSQLGRSISISILMKGDFPSFFYVRGINLCECLLSVGAEYLSVEDFEYCQALQEIPHSFSISNAFLALDDGSAVEWRGAWSSFNGGIFGKNINPVEIV